jgi:molecular chaperone DnaJ
VQGGVAGDLYVKVHVKSDPVFSKEGSTIYMDLKVKLSDAILGATYSVDTLDGPLSVKIPAGIAFGELLRVRGKGVPSGRGRGAVLLRGNIQMPGSLSRPAKKLIEQLREEGL